VQGFQLLKNGKSYGSVIPPDVHSLSVKGLKLGDTAELQLLILTNRVPADGQSHKSNFVDAVSVSNFAFICFLFVKKKSDYRKMV